MSKGAWWARACGVVRVRHDLATKPPPPESVWLWGADLASLNSNWKNGIVTAFLQKDWHEHCISQHRAWPFKTVLWASLVA